MTREKRKKKADSLSEYSEEAYFHAPFSLLDNTKVAQRGAPSKQPTFKKQRLADKENTNGGNPQLSVPHSSKAMVSASGASSQSNVSNGWQQENVEPMRSGIIGGSLTVGDALPSQPHNNKSNSYYSNDIAIRHKAAQLYIRIQLLLAQNQFVHDGMELSCLLQAYFQCFGEPLDYKTLGFTTFQEFCQSIPLVDCKWNGGGWLVKMSLSMPRRSRQERSDPVVRIDTLAAAAVEGGGATDTINLKNEPMLMLDNGSGDSDGSSQARNSDESAGENFDTAKNTTATLPKGTESVDMDESMGSKSNGGGVGGVAPHATLGQEYSAESAAANCVASEPPKQPPLLQHRVTSDEIKERIILLVSRHGAPVNINALPHIYQDYYHEPLDHTTTGCSNLEYFIDTIESINKTFSWQGVLLSMSSSTIYGDSGHGGLVRVKQEDEVMGVSSEVVAKQEMHSPPATKQRQNVCASQSTSSMTQFEFKNRIATLVANHEPLNISYLPALYEKIYKEQFNWRQFRSGKLKIFLFSIDQIAVRESTDGKNQWLLYASHSPKDKTRERQGESPHARQDGVASITIVAQSGGNLPLETMKERVVAIVASNEPLEVPKLDTLYTAAYGKSMRQSIVFRNLRSFVKSLGVVNVTRMEVKHDVKWVLTSASYSSVVSSPARVAVSKEMGDKKATAPPLGNDCDASSALEYDQSEQSCMDQGDSGTIGSGLTASSYDREISRLERIVKEHEPLLISKIPELYKSKFHGECLYARGLGFDNLESFVASIPTIETSRLFNGKNIEVRMKVAKRPAVNTKASASLKKKDVKAAMTDKPPVKKMEFCGQAQQKTVGYECLFRCLKCSELSFKWDTCRSHMEGCCPEHFAVPENEVKERCKVGIDQVMLRPNA